MGGRARRRACAAAVMAVAFAACATPDGISPTDHLPAPDATPGSTTTTTVAGTQAMTLPDISARPITTADLLAMLPVPDTDGSVAVVSNAELVSRAVFDAADETADIERYLRLSGVSGTYPRGDITEHVWIAVLGDPDSAHGYLLDTSGDIVKGAGGTHAPDVGAESATEFPMAVGQEAIGLVLTLDTGTTETAVLFRIGRLVGYASIESPEAGDSRVALQYLADRIARRIVDTLVSGDPTPPLSDEPSYTFETTITIDGSNEQRWVTSSSGQVTDLDRTCEVRKTAPAETVDRELLVVDGTPFWRDPEDTEWVMTTAANRSFADLLALCPSWPLDERAAGLASLHGATGTPHMVNGVAAIGYRSDLAGLEAALGSRLDGVVVQSFSFWIAEGAHWIMELAIVASGDAASLVPLIGTGYEGSITVTLRHRVLELGTGGPILPPG